MRWTSVMAHIKWTFNSVCPEMCFIVNFCNTNVFFTISDLHNIVLTTSLNIDVDRQMA